MYFEVPNLRFFYAVVIFSLFIFIIIDAIIVIVILEVLQSSSIGVYLLFAHTLALAEYL